MPVSIALPRVLAEAASGLFAVIVVGGAVLSAGRLFAGMRRRRLEERYGGGSADGTRTAPAGPLAPGRLAAANVLIAVGTLVLGAGGLPYEAVPQPSRRPEGAG